MKPNFRTVTFVPRTDTEWLALAQEFSLGKSRKYYYNNSIEFGAEVTLHRIRQDDSVKWAIRVGFSQVALGKDGAYYSEKTPSECSDAFLKMCRFDTPDQAVETWLKNENTPKKGPGWMVVKSI